jgi:6-pyruvoyltetrahydropterin/6-carboxytetrahydropterin synthase
MRTELSVSRDFDAAHTLEGIFAPGHNCARLHGHRYTVTLTVSSTKDTDIVIDYHELHNGLREILSDWDHQYLNHVMERAPTCENLGREIIRRAKEKWDGVAWVEVQEQRATRCRVYAEDW